MINEPGKIMVRLPEGHIWTTENIRGLSNLATFLVQLSQLLLVLYLQLGQLLQLCIVPCAIMSWAAIGKRRDVPQTRIQLLLCLCQGPDIAFLGCSVHQGHRIFVTNQATAGFHTTHSSPAKRPSHSTGNLHLLRTRFTFCTFLNQNSNSNGR